MKTKFLSVTTKTGDQGITGLINGQRWPKNHPIFAAIGDTDELNSWLGLLAAALPDKFATKRQFLLKIQNTLFFLGAELAQSPKAKLTEADLKTLELESKKLEVKLAENWRQEFMLPGGTLPAGMADLSRTVCRRAERQVVTLSQTLSVQPLVLKYLNRLSDYLYLLRIWINREEKYQDKFFQKN